MKRADRLYALVDVLRAHAPDPVPTTALAAEFAVTTRTVERDLATLLAAGVPVQGRPGRRGGYVIDRDFSLPPLTFTPPEAYAVLTGLASMGRSPFADEAAAARRKILAALPGGSAAATAARVTDTWFLAEGDPPHPSDQRIWAEALTHRSVVGIEYRGFDGEVTRRDVEPLGLLFIRGAWVVAGWCRLRQAVRGFALDRVLRVEPTGELAPDRGDALAADLSRWAFAHVG